MKEYTQIYSIDFQKTFSFVVKLNTIQIVLSIAANLEWFLQQFDVKNVFLYGDLKKEIYMDVPPSFCYEGEKKMGGLKKTLYSLKQSSRTWFGRFTDAMKNYGYVQTNNVDHTLFFKRRGSKIMVLIIYIDDIIITDNDEGMT
jgi:Reverse transcriptase (RNA-dependent DNA polymerase)